VSYQVIGLGEVAGGDQEKQNGIRRCWRCRLKIEMSECAKERAETDMEWDVQMYDGIYTE